MPEVTVLQTPQTIPDAAQPVQGVPGSRATFFLRSTPKVFTVITAGQGNQDFQIAAVEAHSPLQIARPSSFFTYASPPPTLKELFASISGAGTLNPSLTQTLTFDGVISGYTILQITAQLLGEAPPVNIANQSLRSLRRRRGIWKEWET